MVLVSRIELVDPTPLSPKISIRSSGATRIPPIVHTPDSIDAWSASPLTVSAAAKALGEPVLFTQLVRINIPAGTTTAVAICPVLCLIRSHGMQLLPGPENRMFAGGASGSPGVLPRLIDGRCRRHGQVKVPLVPFIEIE